MTERSTTLPSTDQTSPATEPATKWELQAIRRAHLLHSQLDAATAHARKSKLPELHGMDFLADDSPYMQQLLAFYREHLGLARLLDSSDLLLHAEGPGAAHHNPRLGAVNWLCTNAEKHLKQLMQAMLPMDDRSGKMAVSEADLRLTGLAQGSLYAGFALAGLYTNGAQHRLDNSDDAPTLLRLRQAIHALPMVPQYVGTDGMDRDILDALPDPALRDAAMVAAHDLAPTGNKGIHTVEISSPTADDRDARSAHPLGQRERVVLGDALRNAPMMRNTTHGNFVGVLRAIDLDRNRITLRHISDDIPALRCVLPNGDSNARQWLDRQVRVEGDYETNASGQPRMMRVHSISAVPMLG